MKEIELYYSNGAVGVVNYSWYDFLPHLIKQGRIVGYIIRDLKAE